MVSATPSPSGSAGPADVEHRTIRRLIPARVRRLGPRTLQGRLTLGFSGVVALTLFLVTIFVLNRLDDEFRQQQLADLQARTGLVAAYVDVVAAEKAAPDPVIGPDNVVNPRVASALRSDAYQSFIADQLAEADVDIVLGRQPTTGGDAAPIIPAVDGTFHASVLAPGRAGLTQESFAAQPLQRPATFSAFQYTIVVRLSNPYTFRQTAIDNVATVSAAVGALALGIAVIVAAAMALRVTTPLRRLTEASRALAEGQLGERIPRAEIRTGPAEIAALATQFNAMADQVEESVERIRRDRDRSRDFLADVSHELRTPIAALLTFNELLTERAGDDPGARAEFLHNSRVQLERLDWLAQNLLELSKLDSGLVLLDLRPDDLRVAVESAVEQARPAGRRRRLTIDLHLPNAPIRIRHDPQRVGQVVTNLVGNAIKFTEPGGTVSVRVAPAIAGEGGAGADGADGATITVGDTGVGIEPDELPRIFDRFYRGSRANEARASGSGLGLAIVRSIVEMHHGTVEVTSRLGSGTTFSVTLPSDPRREHGPDGTAPEPLRPIEESPDRGKMVDSSPTARPSLNGETSV
ncbi:MAG: HAMP domain-containing histidine kinase [Chloroflexi bacterium]|nr:MAG: HAMP domain-containing histidine kinase [Chloroflexota bacterium]